MTERNHRPRERGYLDIGNPETCREHTAHARDARRATDRWHLLMAAHGIQPRGTPKRIAPPTVPMGGSSMGSV